MKAKQADILSLNKMSILGLIQMWVQMVALNTCTILPAKIILSIFIDK